MTAIQTTYPDEIRPAVAGQRADQTPATFASRNVEDEDGIGFGVAVAQGEDDHGCKAFGSGDTAIFGITVRERSLDANESNGWPEHASARIITKGTVWVQASVAVDAGDPVYVIPATGAFAKTSASSAVQIPNARWETSVGEAGLAVVRLA